MSTYLITGSNRGIGLEFCRQLQSRGDNVIATCRDCSSKLIDLGVRVESGVDITSENSIIRLREKLVDVKLDVVIHNAGIAEFNSISNLKEESIIRQFKVNALGPLIFTNIMLKNMNKGSKIAFITSRMGSIGDNTSGSSYGYRMSKVALCMLGKSLSIDLIPHEILVAILHPGLVSTRMTGFSKNGIPPEDSVQGLIKRIDGLTSKNTGTFWHANGNVLPW